MSEVDTTRTESVWLNVSGMSCGSCAANFERALLAVAGTERAAVNLASGRVAG